MRVDEGEQVGTYWFHTDHLGSTSLLSDGDGDPVPGSQVRYLPYGEYRTTPTANLTDVGFTGHRDTGLGLVYMRARYYVQSIGRFLSADSIAPNPADPQQLNRYSYARNNALRYTDPTGHYLFEEQPDDPWIWRAGNPYGTLVRGDSYDSFTNYDEFEEHSLFEPVVAFYGIAVAGALLPAAAAEACTPELARRVSSGLLSAGGEFFGGLISGEMPTWEEMTAAFLGGFAIGPTPPVRSVPQPLRTLVRVGNGYFYGIAQGAFTNGVESFLGDAPNAHEFAVDIAASAFGGALGELVQQGLGPAINRFFSATSGEFESILKHIVDLTIEVVEFLAGD